MKADEIAVVLLILMFVRTAAAAALHSRRREKAPDGQDSQIEDKTAVSPPGPVDEERAEPRRHRKKQRR